MTALLVLWIGLLCHVRQTSLPSAQDPTKPFKPAAAPIDISILPLPTELRSLLYVRHATYTQLWRTSASCQISASWDKVISGHLLQEIV